MQITAEHINEVLEELDKLKRESSFPVHVAAQAAVVSAAAGDVLNTALKIKYNTEKPEDIEFLKFQLRKQLIRTTAQTFRFIENL